MRMRVQPAHKRSLIDQTAFRSPPFWLFTLGLFFGFMGLYVPFFYVQSYALDKQIMSANSAFYMLSVINAASIFGRIIPNWLADRIGPLNVLIPGTAIACVVAFGWIGIHSVGGLVVFCLLYGFSSGSFVSIPPTVIVTLSPSLSVVGTRMGMTFAISGIGLLIGTPVAGQILLRYGYIPAIAYCGACVLVSVALFTATRLHKTGMNVMKIA
jgi:predicted MFS family arabinose efflux permease